MFFFHCVSLPILWFHPTSDAMDKSMEAEPNVSAQLAWIKSWAKTYKWTVSIMWHHTYKLVIYSIYIYIYIHIYIYYKYILHKHHHTLYIYVALSIYIYNYIYTHTLYIKYANNILILKHKPTEATQRPHSENKYPHLIEKYSEQFTIMYDEHVFSRIIHTLIYII